MTETRTAVRSGSTLVLSIPSSDNSALTLPSRPRAILAGSRGLQSIWSHPGLQTLQARLVPDVVPQRLIATKRTSDHDTGMLAETLEIHRQLTIQHYRPVGF